jgi:DNA polymerase V
VDSLVVKIRNNVRRAIPHNLEARQWVAMGDPVFKIRDIIKRENVAVFSSNYSLYGSLSEKVTSTLLSMVAHSRDLLD